MKKICCICSILYNKTYTTSTLESAIETFNPQISQQNTA